MDKNSVNHPLVKLIVGFIFRKDNDFKHAQALLLTKFGDIDFQSPSIEFNHTSYYLNEFGDNLQRKFISFKKLIPPESLSNIKIFTNRLEKNSSSCGNRCINIDPGYLTLAKLLLVSTKDYAHRIYLGKGIFAEIALCYKGKSFASLPWTYPDYRSDAYLGIFNHIRNLYYRQTIQKENL